MGGQLYGRPMGGQPQILLIIQHGLPDRGNPIQLLLGISLKEAEALILSLIDVHSVRQS
jgi:hypothetical protein